MANLETSYLGIPLKNPIIVSSSGLTNSVDKIKKIEEAGAGAVVLKSLFEEQINHEAGNLIADSNDYPEAEDYIRNYSKSNSVGDYLQLIMDAKKQVSIPIIASINCISSTDWIDFASKIEEAGADALELNIHILSMDEHLESFGHEQKYLDIIEKVKEKLDIPISIKLGSHFSNLAGFVNKLYHRKVEGVVLFNRFYQPDIDIENLSFTSGSVFSNEADIRNSLRWVGIISDKIQKVEVSASTGVHDGAAAVKLLLAGAKTVQVCSVLYKNGVSELSKILEELNIWMDKMEFATVADFNGIMNYGKIKNPAIYERAQFMRYFSNLE